MGETLENVGMEELQQKIDDGEIDVEDLQNPPEQSQNEEKSSGVADEDLRKQEEEKNLQEDADYSFTIDVSKYPSKGIPYDFDTIKARGALVSELKNLDILNTSGNFTEFHSKLFKFLQSATDVDVTNLTYGDEIPLFIDLRANTYPNGETFPLEFDCSSCENHNKINFHLSELTFDELGEDYEEPKVYEVDDKEVKLSVLREGDILDIETLVNKFIQGNVLTGYDFDVTDLYKTATKASAILFIEGSNIKEDWRVLDQEERIHEVAKRVRLIENDRITYNQYRVLEAFEEKYSHDIDLNAEIECVHCGEVNDNIIPMSREFFYPDDQGITTDNLSDFEA